MWDLSAASAGISGTETLCNVCVMFISLPPVSLHRVCLAALCAGQCSIKCDMVSSACWHVGHIGESVFLMW